MQRPTLKLADIFRRHGPSYRQRHALPKYQLRLMRAIEVCRTATLGGHALKCSQCGFKRYWYNSCRNRHCPTCQSMARAQWLDQRRRELLPVSYFHVVFTVPEQIAEIAFYNKRVVYDILFRATAQTLLTIAADPKHLGAHIGYFAVLHTWGQNLLHHPHLHCVIPGGGVCNTGESPCWIASRKKFFVSVLVLSAMFQRVFLKMLRVAFKKGELQFFSKYKHLQVANNFYRYLDPLEKIKWVVYCKQPFGGPEHVLEYLGRYTHRVAISNQRLVSDENDEISFTWKDYRNSSEQKVMPLKADEFIRRFLLHSLPPGFQRIRHYGLFANPVRRKNLELCRQLLAVLPPKSERQPKLAFEERYEALTGQPFLFCPACQLETMEIVELFAPQKYVFPEDST